jgi:predicted DNA-binding transcriptional regulator AlpA
VVRLPDATLPDDQVLIGPQQLSSYGISISQRHMRRLILEGRFPQPVRPSPGRIAWRRCDIKSYLAALPLNALSSEAPRPRRAT